MDQRPLTLDIDGAAEMLKVHQQTVRNMINAGALPAAKVGRAWVILTSDVLAFIEQQVARQTAERLGGVRSRRRRRSSVAVDTTTTLPLPAFFAKRLGRRRST